LGTAYVFWIQQHGNVNERRRTAAHAWHADADLFGFIIPTKVSKPATNNRLQYPFYS
jgi:hypothetical protein